MDNMSTKTPVIGEGLDAPEPSSEWGWLINRNFALLSIGQAISNIGDFVYSTTLLIWVYALGGSAAAVSGVLIAQYAPILILGPIAGVFVDRWNRLQTMIASDVARAIIALLPLIAFGPLRLPAIYCSVFLISVISRFFMPARAAMTQVIVPDARQAQAASIGQTTMALSIVLGPALASPLYLAVGPVIAVLINSGSYAASALFLRGMHVSRASLILKVKTDTGSLEAGQKMTGVRAVGRELLDGFRFVLTTRLLWMVIVLGMIAMFGAGAINALEIIYVRQRLHADTNLYGYLTAAGGVGSLLGAIGSGLLAKRIKPRTMLVGSLTGLGIGIAIYALQVHFVAALLLGFLISIPQGGIDVALAPMIMWVTPRRLMGRTQGVMNTAMFGASLLSIAVAGILGVFVPAYLLLFGGGVMIFLSGIYGWLALPAVIQPGEDAGAFEEAPAGQ